VTAPAPSRWGRFGGRPLAVLCLVGLVDAVDRGVLPAVIEPVQRDLGFNDFQGGLLYTALIVAALLVAVPGGLLADRTDRRRLMAGVLVLWSLATGLAGAVQAFWQLFAVRAALGVGDAINDPAAQSLVADYYAADVRGRAYAWQRVVPTVGLGLGTALGGALYALFGWRVAVLAIGLPGIAVALLVRRLPLPERGDSDAAGLPQAVLSTREAVRATLAVPSLRALLVAVAFINGVLSALAFWGIAYHVRSSGMSEASAPAIAGSVILLGAIGGGVTGGLLTDRVRGLVPGALMLLAAVVTGAGSLLLLASFVDGLPVYGVRLPLQLVGVALVVSSLPPITVIGAEVVPPALRGTSFGITKLCANLLGALLPPLMGLLADSHPIRLSSGAVKGDLGFAFRCTTGLVLVGSLLLLRGRKHLDADVARALVPELTPSADGWSTQHR
jgi:MFS family permease